MQLSNASRKGVQAARGYHLPFGPDDRLFPFAKPGGRRDFLQLHHLKPNQIARALVLSCAVIALLSCSQRQGPSEYKANLQTKEVVDEAGRKVTLPVKIERVISLAPNLTEIVYALPHSWKLLPSS